MTERIDPDSFTSAASDFDAYARTYDDAVNQSLAFTGLKVDYFTRVKAGYVRDLAARHFGAEAHASLLDVGCGIGNLHPQVRSGFGSISGCDISAACIAEAAVRNPFGSYCHYDGERLPHDDNTFDMAITVCVMHHVPPMQWPAFAAEMKRVVRPGGLVAVFEHNPANPLTCRAVSDCEFDEDAVLLKPEMTRNLLRDAGFSAVRSRSILSLPSFGPISRKFDLVAGRLGLGAQYFVTGVA